MSIGGTLAGSLAGHGDNLDAQLIALLGADLIHWWEPRDNTVTLNGGNISAITALAGAANMSEATAAQQPLYVASGGPNNRPYLSLQDAARNIGATVSIGAANRAGMFAVVASDWVSAQIITASANGGGAGYEIGNEATTGRFRSSMRFTGAAQTINHTVPATHNNWRIHALLPYAAGAESQIDRAVTIADFTGTDTMVAITNIHFGFVNAIVCGGRAANIIIVNDVDAAKAAIVYDYYADRFAL